jgi:hypothetical protein
VAAESRLPSRAADDRGMTHEHDAFNLAERRKSPAGPIGAGGTRPQRRGFPEIEAEQRYKVAVNWQLARA